VRREVEATVEHLRSVLGEEAWEKGMNPDVPETTVLDDPYTYTEYHRPAPTDADPPYKIAARCGCAPSWRGRPGSWNDHGRQLDHDAYRS
jgi:hypothetical protein